MARWMVGGRRFARSTETGDRALAERRLAEFTAPFRVKDEVERLEMWKGRLEGAVGRLREAESAAPALRLDEAWKAYVESPDRPEGTSEARLKFCRARFGFFLDFMRERHPEVAEARQVTKAHAREFADEGLACKAGTTRNEIIGLLRTMWRVLAELDAARIADNPWAKVKRVRAVVRSRRELTPQELTAVCSSVGGEMRTLFLVGVYTGLRLGDCAMLRWENVDFERGAVCVVPRKTAHSSGASVTVPMHPALRRALAEASTDGERRGYVMKSIAAEYERRPVSLSAKVCDVFRACGIETTGPAGEGGGRRRVIVGFHSLRHTFVSLCANAGVPLAVVQKIVGHSTVEMTRHYYHESEAAMRAAVAALPDVLSGEDGSAALSLKARTILSLFTELSENEKESVRTMIFSFQRQGCPEAAGHCHEGRDLVDCARRRSGGMADAADLKSAGR